MMDLSTLLITTPLLAITLDLDGRVTSLNPAAAALAGRMPEGLLGAPFTELLDPGSHAKARLLLERVRRAEVVRDWELDHLQPAQAPALISHTATMLWNDQGIATGIGLIGRDLRPELDLIARLAATN